MIRNVHCSKFWVRENISNFEIEKVFIESMRVCKGRLVLDYKVLPRPERDGERLLVLYWVYIGKKRAQDEALCETLKKSYHDSKEKVVIHSGMR